MKKPYFEMSPARAAERQGETREREDGEIETEMNRWPYQSVLRMCLI